MPAVVYAIVEARLRDLDAIPRIERAAARLLEGHAPASVLDEVTDGRTLREARSAGRLWVALADDVAVGFALVELLSDGSPHLEEIDVHPDHGRRGLGAALVATVCEWAARAGHREITLTTFRDVPWNMPFYRRLGFEEVPGDRLGPALATVVRDEAARGLDSARRTVMRRPLAAGDRP